LPLNPEPSVTQVVKKVRSITQVENFDLAVVLGSGWSRVAQLGDLLGTFSYDDWTCFPGVRVAGHEGKLVAVRYSGWNILFFSGRFHCYQGLTAYQAAVPVRVADALGCKRIMLTCASGGINNAYRPGDFMLVDDHLNLLGDNPLRGLPGSIFVDMAGAYRQEVYDNLPANNPAEITVHRGVLAAMPGPCYETPAEIRFLAASGADVVSMSVVPETIMARYLGMMVAAVAFVANPAAGTGSSLPLTHLDVLDCGTKHAHRFPTLVSRLVVAWQKTDGRDPERSAPLSKL